MAARPGITSAWRRRSPSAASWWTRPIPNIVYVAAVGHLFGPNKERGLYKSTDGGKNWKKAKYIDPDTGFTDVAIDPSNPKILYAASFQRRRTWWGYNGGGPGSALWKTTDGGDTWTKLEGPGWPKPKDGIYGRIAISIFRANPKIIYAQVEAGASGGTGAGTGADGGPARGGRGGAADPAAVRGESPHPRRSAERGGSRQPAERFRRGGGGGGRGRGANAPPDPNGSGVFRSDDGGKTWTFMSNQNQRPMYFSQIRVDPVNDQKLFVGGNAGADVHRWRQDLDSAHRLAHRLPRLLDQSQGSAHRLGRPRWRPRHQQRRRRSTGIITTTSRWASSTRCRPTCAARITVCGGLQDNNAWCGPSALRSQHRPGEYRLVHGSRRRRLLHPPGSHRLGHCLRRIAGRQHDPSRSAQRHAEEHPAERRTRRQAARRQRESSAPTATPPAAGGSPAPTGAPRIRRRLPRQRRQPAEAGVADAAGTPNVINAPPNIEPSASTGTRPSRFRRTIRR